MPVIILGSNGLLGQAITAQAAMQIIAPSHAQLDVCDHAAVAAFIAQHRPALVVNCTAYSAVDAAQDAPDRAAALNHRAVAHLVQACDAVAASLVHFSTDFVFDGLRPGASGQATRPYTEDDPAHPLSVYGATKLAGEQAVLASSGAHYVFRVSWLYGRDGKNFFSQVNQWLQQDRVLRIVNDQVSVPNDVVSIAKAFTQWCNLWAGLEQSTAQQFLQEHCGLYHLVGRDVMGRYTFAQRVAAQLGPLAIAQLEAVPASTFAAPARRPMYSAMSAAKFERVFGILI
jgi:dTDP-4-dehydrorhamnose reductase